MCDEWYCVNTARSWGDIRNGTILSASVGLTCFVVFGLLRHTNKVFRTRLEHRSVATKPPPLPSLSWRCLWDWIVHVLCVSERTLYDTAGLDALYFDRSNRLCLLIAVFLAVVNLGVVLPVNFSLGTVIQSAEALHVGGMSKLDKISMTNIAPGSPLLWIHTVAVVLTSLFVSFLLCLQFMDYRGDRQGWLGHSVEEEDSKSFAEEDDRSDMGSFTTPTNSERGTLRGGSSSVGSFARVSSLLRRQLSAHVRDHEQAEARREQSVFSLQISEVHSPISVFHRQHVSVPVVGSDTTFAVKAQQYAVLVTDVDPASRAIQNPGGHLSLNRAAENEVARAFQSLFDDFIAAVPVRYHAKVDKLLRCLDQAQVMLLRIDDRLENSHANSKKAQKLSRRRDELEREMKLLVRDIARAQGDAHLDYRSGLSYFVMFKSQVSAAIAAQTLIQEPGGHLAWHVRAAPAPDDINFSALWMYPGQKWWRSCLAKVAVAGIIVFPIGVFTSSMISLSAALCSKDSSWRWDWYCRNAGDDTQTFFFRLITAWVPSLLLATWNSIVVPFGFAFLALFEGTESTLNGIDRKVFRWFYLYSCINVVLGGMLAGTLFSQLENIIKSPSSVFVLLGHAVPQSSGFFLAYISTNAFMLEPIRLIFPHSGVAMYVLSGCRKKTKLCGRVERDRTDCWAPKSMRLGSHYGSQQLILLIALLFSSASPLVTALAVVYFLFGFIIWRYQILYVFVRSYESGALVFPALFSRIICSLCIYQVFMSAYLLIKAAYVQAFVLNLIVPPFLWQFHSYCQKRFTTKSVYLPLALAKEMPVASIPLDTFTAPQMHPQFKGWMAEVGKVWQGYGAFVKKFI